MMAQQDINWEMYAVGDISCMLKLTLFRDSFCSLGYRTTNERFLRIYLATGQRRTCGGRIRRGGLPRPTEPWEEYDTDPAMNIIVVLLFPGRKEERQRARAGRESHPL